ncbi:hypothetical protein SAMD00019534_123310, partial [Acytostelium subglobosum LB1]|uniref:hypothetical protein n=1 Tax=Acytostelium subglobosum LB1 TaxID=1410327 RepID=UPI0006447C13
MPRGKGKKKQIFKSLLCCFSDRTGGHQKDNHNNNKTNRTQHVKQELINVNHTTGAHLGLSQDTPDCLLKPIAPGLSGKKTLVLDLDETLVHSSFKPVPNADFIVPVEIEGQVHQVYVLKRPHVDQFLMEISQKFEIVVFTASLSKYADPVLDLLDPHHVVHHRLFREACHPHKGNFVKDLSKIGRDLKSTIIVDNSPMSYLFHPENAIPIESWFDSDTDIQLLEMLPLLDSLIQVDDVRTCLDVNNNRA